MGGGLSITNETPVDIIVVLSQAGPLNWVKLTPRETKNIECGKVWFTVDARLYHEGSEPSKWSVARPFLIGIGVGVAIVATGGMASAPAIAAATSTGAGVASGFGMGATAIAAGFSSGYLGSQNQQKMKDMRARQTKEMKEMWEKITKSETSAKWLADNQITEVVPASVSGVYADCKQIKITHSVKDSQLILYIKHSHEKDS